MTIKTIAVVGAALILFAVPTQSFAKSHQVSPSIEYDRHSISGSYYYGAEPFQYRVRPSKRARVAKSHENRSKGHPGGGNGHRLTAKSGAQTSVSIVAMPHFRCLLERLETAGYHIDFMGGYASRGNASAHPTGNALDINQTGRNVVTRRLPSNATEMARDCGLVHGAVWSNPDTGHFEMARKYGYVFHHRRTRYAAR